MYKPTEDPFVIASARAAAWADSGFTGIDFTGEVPTGFPDGWPDGVDGLAYLGEFVQKYVRAEENQKPEDEPVEQTPLVARFRKLLGD